MTDMARFEAGPGLSGAAAVRFLGIDDLSPVRYLHARGRRALALVSLPADKVEAFAAQAYAPAYSDRLADTVNQGRMLGAWMADDLVGTAAWHETADELCASIAFVFVLPLFTGLGLGRRLVVAAEQMARLDGHTRLEACAPDATIGFFERLGYRLGPADAARGQDVPMHLMLKVPSPAWHPKPSPTAH